MWRTSSETTMAGPQPTERVFRGSASRSGRNADIIPISQLTAEVKAGIRILVVDDERTLRESCASVLRYEGYEVCVCGRGEDAKELVRRGTCGIAMLDLYMTDRSEERRVGKEGRSRWEQER